MADFRAHGSLAEGLDLWVDAAAGSDWNTGASSSPLRTISAAVQRIPMVVRQPVTVHVNRGVYEERLDLASLLAGSGRVDFIAEDWNPHVPASGIRSGTFDGDFGARPLPNTATCAGAGWGVDDLKGTFVHIAGGADKEAYLPIAGNAETTLDFGMPADRTTGGGRDLRGQRFELVEPAVVLRQQGIQSHLVNVTGPTPVSTRGGDGTWHSSGVLFRNFRFDCGIAGWALACGTGGVLRLQSCKLEFSPRTVYGVYGYRSAASFAATDCYWAMRSSTNYGVVAEVGSRVTLTNCVMDDGWRAAIVKGSVFGVSGLYQNQRQTGIQILKSTVYCYSNFAVRGQPSGVIVFDGSDVDIMPAVGCGSIRNAGEAGIRLGLSPDVSGSGNVVQLTNCTIEACGNGFEIHGSHNTVDVQNCAIKDNVQWGFNLAASRQACLNAVATDPATTMSGNQSGDFSIDGTTPISLADLRARPNREVASTSRFNRLIES
jgi:hypothetical protein